MRMAQPLVAILVAGWAISGQAAANLDLTKLAKDLQNPLADLISVPFQYNWNYNYGPNDDTQGILNVEPVIPIHLNSDWNLVTRTIVPFLSQPGFGPDAGRSYGMGDTQLSGFLSPNKNANGFVWGAGAITQLKTASHDDTGQGRWGLGPTAVALHISKEWVYGALINNVFDIGGDSNREKINQLLLQPFVNYNFPTHPGRYLSFSPIITANWKAKDTSNTWTVPLGLGIGQVLPIGHLPVNLRLACYYNVVRPDNASNFQVQLQFVMLFPE